MPVRLTNRHALFHNQNQKIDCSAKFAKGQYPAESDNKVHIGTNMYQDNTKGINKQSTLCNWIAVALLFTKIIF